MKKRNGKFTITEVGALIEDLRSQFRVFGEGLTGLGERFDTFEDRFDTFENRFDTLESRFDALDAKLEALTGIVRHEAKKSESSRMDIADLKNSVIQINGKVAEIEKDIGFIKDNLASKADRKEFELLEKKVAALRN